MDSCPNEILGLIFAETCTDDGRTGRSLSLVSRRIRNASRRYALQCVAIYGHHQLSAFASLLDQIDPEDRCIYHLYLTDRRRALMEYRPGQAREQWYKERISEGVSDNDFSPISSPSSILRILTAVSPSLQTLTLLLFHRYGEPIFSDALHFLELCDLTIHSSTLFLTTRLGTLVLPQCPRLRRLHIIQNSTLGRTLAKAVSSFSPHLTHLRLSRVCNDTPWTLEGGILHDLERMIQPEDVLDLDGPSTARFPSTLERVLVQMARRRLLGPMRERLRDIAMRDTRQRIVLLKNAKRVEGWTVFEDTMDVPFHMGIRAAWEERIGGAETAIWDVERSAILASYGYSAETEN